MTLQRHDLLEALNHPGRAAGPGANPPLLNTLPSDAFAVAVVDRGGMPRIVHRRDLAGTEVPAHYTTLQTEVSKG